MLIRRIYKYGRSTVEKMKEKQNATEIIDETDNMIYRLYDLSDSEIAMINNFVKKKRKL